MALFGKRNINNGGNENMMNEILRLLKKIDINQENTLQKLDIVESKIDNVKKSIDRSNMYSLDAQTELDTVFNFFKEIKNGKSIYLPPNVEEMKVIFKDGKEESEFTPFISYDSDHPEGYIQVGEKVSDIEEEKDFFKGLPEEMGDIDPEGDENIYEDIPPLDPSEYTLEEDIPQSNYPVEEDETIDDIEENSILEDFIEASNENIEMLNSEYDANLSPELLDNVRYPLLISLTGNTKLVNFIVSLIIRYPWSENTVYKKLINLSDEEIEDLEILSNYEKIQDEYNKLQQTDDVREYSLDDIRLIIAGVYGTINGMTPTTKLLELIKD